MTRKDHIQIAKALYRVRRRSYNKALDYYESVDFEKIVDELVKVLRKDNKSFDAEKFLLEIYK